MGQGTAAVGQVTDLYDDTRDQEFALEFLRSGESDNGNPYGPETTTMRKRGVSANRRVGMIATQSERVRKTSATRRNGSSVPRGRPDPTEESADASLDRQISEQRSEQANRPHSNP
eukprot:2212566-Heterocapsa_arctica.AAC.1